MHATHCSINILNKVFHMQNSSELLVKSNMNLKLNVHNYSNILNRMYSHRNFNCLFLINSFAHNKNTKILEKHKSPEN